MVAIKIHTAVIRSVGQLVGKGSIAGSRQLVGPEVAVRGYAEQISTGDAFKEFGLQLTNPTIFMCDVNDATHFTAECEIQIGDRTYTMHGEPLILNAGDPCDYAEIALTRKERPLPRANQ